MNNKEHKQFIDLYRPGHSSGCEGLSIEAESGRLPLVQFAHDR